jgi:hypothetical protein
MIELISALLMAGSTPVTNEAARDLVVLRVRAYADQQVDEATIRPALEVADRLDSSWHGVCVTRRNRARSRTRRCRRSSSSFRPVIGRTAARTAVLPLTAHATQQER